MLFLKIAISPHRIWRRHVSKSWDLIKLLFWEGDSLAVQWLGLTAEGWGSIPGQVTRISQVTWHDQIKKKKIFFYCFIKDILKWKWHLKRNLGICNGASRAWCHCVCAKMLAILPTVAVSIVGKGKWCFNIMMKIVLTMKSPWKSPRTSRAHWPHFENLGGCWDLWSFCYLLWFFFFFHSGRILRLDCLAH